MADLPWWQYALISLCFYRSGFVRSGLGFGDAALTLPFLLPILNESLIFLPVISIHLLIFSSWIAWTFIIAGVDLQLVHQLWLLPCAFIGHLVGERFHRYVVSRETPLFFRLLGSVLIVVSVVGLVRQIRGLIPG